MHLSYFPSLSLGQWTFEAKMNSQDEHEVDNVHVTLSLYDSVCPSLCLSVSVMSLLKDVLLSNDHMKRLNNTLFKILT